MPEENYSVQVVCWLLPQSLASEKRAVESNVLVPVLDPSPESLKLSLGKKKILITSDQLK